MRATMEAPNKISPPAAKVAEDLLEIGAVQLNIANPFTWVSGIKSPVYCDNRKVNSNVKVRNNMVDSFVDLIKSKFPDVQIIAGVATGGMPLGTLIADRMNLPFVYIRQEKKEHGLMKQVEGVFNKGDKMVVIEDHISTGGSSIKAIQGARSEGLELLGLVSLMTYRFEKATKAFQENNIAYYSLCDLETIVDVALNAGTITENDKNTVLEFKRTQGAA